MSPRPRATMSWPTISMAAQVALAESQRRHIRGSVWTCARTAWPANQAHRLVRGGRLEVDLHNLAAVTRSAVRDRHRYDWRVAARLEGCVGVVPGGVAQTVSEPERRLRCKLCRVAAIADKRAL